MSDSLALTMPTCPVPPAAGPKFHHRFDVCCPLPSLSIRACLTLTEPWTILFGPSGSGKSSLLRAACGLLHRKGMVIARREPNGLLTILQDHDSFVAPHLRGFRWAPQHDALFPHLNVRENVAFGIRSHRSSAEAVGQQDLVASVMSLFDLSLIETSMPLTLSGGERRRVSLARAFAAPDCRLLLLDEPFSGLDHAYRDALIPRMRAWLASRNIPVLSVTHDVEEPIQLEAEVVLVLDGKIRAQGPAVEVLASERERSLHNLQFPGS